MTILLTFKYMLLIIFLDGAGTINRLNIATKNQTTLRNVGFPDILALDWATDNIYVVNKDHVKKSIHVRYT